MKKINKKILLVISLMLVLTLSVGLTMAYFSDHTEAKGGKQIALGGQTKINEDPYDGYKLITIENIGDTDVVVRVAVYGPTAITYEPEVAADWHRDGDYVYYTKVLPAPKDGQKSETSQIKASWTLPEGFDPGDDFNVVVTQESDQAVYNDKGEVETPKTTPTWDFSGYPKAN